MLSWILSLKVVEVKKKRGETKIDGFTKKVMIPESEIPECPEFEVKSKMETLFMNEKVFEEFSVKIYEIDPFLKSIAKKK